jgi:hypothetical protein
MFDPELWGELSLWTKVKIQKADIPGAKVKEFNLWP